MKPRGVTLVELLAAISIMVIVTALAMPAVRNRLGAAKLESAQGQIETAVLTTRAEAMRLGRPVALAARTRTSGEVELVLTPLEQTESAIEGPSGAKKEASRRPAERIAKPGEVWATLAAGLKLTIQPEVNGEVKRIGAAPATQPRGRDAAGEDVKIAVFCPDGTAIAPGPTYLSDGDVTLAVTVNTWIGSVGFVAYTAENQATSDRTEDGPVKAAAASTGSTGRTR